MSKKQTTFVYTLISAALLLALGMAGISLLGGQGLSRISKLESQLDALQHERRQLKHELQTLQQQVEALGQGGAYREKIIRDELGYVRRDEVILDTHHTTKE